MWRRRVATAGCLALLLIGETPPVQARDGGTADAGATSAPRHTSLIVVVAGSAPFVMGTGEQPTGFSVELWRTLADRLGLSFTLRRRDNVGDAIDQVASGRADVVVGPVSITADRAARVQFTQPYLSSGLAIAAKAELSVWKRLLPLASKAFVAGVGFLLIVLLGVGTVLWLLERKKNPKMFPDRPLAGIGNGIWFALVTMTTVGYGDRVPVSVGGRIMAGIWMVVAMLTVSSLTAGIATTLTVLNLGGATVETVDDLSGQRVAVVRATPAVEFVERARGRPVVVGSVVEALSIVRQGRAIAVVHDRPVLAYELSRGFEELSLSPEIFDRGRYGFAVSRGSPLVGRLDRTILELEESGTLRTLERRFIEGSDE